MSSIASNASTVIFRGGEEDIETVLRTAIKEVQNYLNLIEMDLICLSAQTEQDNDFQPMYKNYTSINNGVDDLVSVMKELKGVSKQLLPSCKGEDKAWKKDYDETNKRERKLKADQVAQQQLATVEESKE